MLNWKAETRASMIAPVDVRLTRRAALGGMLAAPAAASAAGGPPAGAALAAAARRQIGVTTSYDHRYRPIRYPWGDVPRSTGVCADVVVRAARDAWGVDLQERVHEDMARDFAAYPHRWGLTGPESNIDHRRVPNLETYWTRAGARIWQTAGRTWGFAFPRRLEVGDILTWRTFLNGGPHVAIVSRVGAWPRVIQNYAWGVHEDLLAQQWIDAAQAHFRWRPWQGSS
jgi:uncharacterized protein YijF (DUF1287 family)